MREPERAPASTYASSMSDAPVPASPALDFTPLVSDFYGFENDLTDQEKDVIMRLRHYLETEVKPIVNDHWARAEFPMQIVKGLADLGCSGCRGRRPAASRTPRCSEAGSPSSSPASTRASPPWSACRTGS